MGHRPRILLVEDEEGIRGFLHAALAAEGYAVTETASGAAALDLCASNPPDLILLDLGLPDMDGKRMVAQLRSWSAIPVIILSARSDEAEKVKSFDLGADDYLTKPCSVGELLTRIRNLLRRASSRESLPDDVCVSGDLAVDLGRRRVSLRGEDVRLTPVEYGVLAALAQGAGRVVTHGELLAKVWGREADGSDHYLRIYVQRLRKKLGDDPLRPRYIFTEPGIGYRLDAKG